MKLFDYISGHRKGKAAQQIERDAQTDIFLGEALDGFDSVAGEHAKNIENLQQKIAERSKIKRKNGNRKLTIFGIAASVNIIVAWSAAACVIVAVGGWLYTLSGTNGGNLAISDNGNSQYNNRYLAGAKESEAEIIEENYNMPANIDAPEPAKDITYTASTKKMDIVNNTESIKDVVNFDKDKEAAQMQEIKSVDKPKIEEEQEIEENIPSLIAIEKQAKFMGKDANEFKIWVEKNLQSTNENGITGTAVVSFVVDENGNVKDINIVKKLLPEIDAEIVRTISKSPQWTPAEQMHKKVAMEFTLPITFEFYN